MNYLVTGGTGFIGRSLVRALVERGDFVRCLDDDSRGSKLFLSDLKDDVEFITGDVRNPITVWSACRDIDCVCHLAYINGTGAFYTIPDRILDVAVRGMANVLDACLKRHVPEILLASTSEVYQTAPVVPTDELVPLSIPDPLNPRYSYAGGKIVSELMVLNARHFQRAMIVRPHNIYGPNMGTAHVIPQLIEKVSITDAAQESGPLSIDIQGTGKETRAFCYIEDAIRGILAVLDKGKHRNIYNLGTPEEVMIEDLVRVIGRKFGREVRIVPGDLQPGGTLRRCPDISKLMALGYEPQVCLDTGVGICVQEARAACLVTTAWALS